MSTTASFPDATNTGVPPGVTLTASGNLVITQPGVVISGLDIKGTVFIEAPNVTLQDCKITAAAWSVVVVQDGVTGAVVQNCEINGVGTNNEGSCGISGQGTFLNNNIYNVENGIAPGSNSLVQGNYIHDLVASGSPHYDGIQIDGNISNVAISHNSVINGNGQTSAVMIDNDFGPTSNIQVDNNLLVGGGYTLYSDGRGSSASITGVSFTNNHIGGGQFGDTSFDNNTPTYSGNVGDGAALAAKLNTAANTGSPAESGTANTSPASSDANSGTTAPTQATDTTPPDAPIFTGDTVVGNKVQVSGTAEAGSTVNLYDGSSLVGTTHAAADGNWNVTTSALSPGSHTFVATATDSAGNTSDASQGLDPVIPSSTSGDTSSTASQATETLPPNAPVLTADTVHHHTVHVTGTADAGSTISLYEGATVLGTAEVGSDSHFNIAVPSLSTGAHSFFATATDEAGNTSSPSEALDAMIKASSSHLVPSLAGNSSGPFLQSTGALQHHHDAFESALQNQVASSDWASAPVTAPAMLAGAHWHVQSGTGGDTFVFAANFGSGLASNSMPTTSDHITSSLGQSAFENFASVLAQASQAGHDPGFAAGQDTLTLKDLKHGVIGTHDFHFG